MAVYVDSENIRWRGRVWCHLVADSLDELHCFALQLGLRRQWFQDQASYPHYDVTLAVRERALKLGAQSADRRTIIGCCKRMRLELMQQRMGVAVLAESCIGGIHGVINASAAATIVAAIRTEGA